MTQPPARPLVLAAFLSAAVGLALGGCANIPSGAAQASDKASQGVVAMDANTQAILDAWRESLKLAVRESFDDIYSQMKAVYLTRERLPATTQLNDDQARDVAVLVAEALRRADKKIDDDINAIKARMTADAQSIRSTNADITALLQSAGRVGAARAQVIRELGQISPAFNTVTDVLTKAKEAARQL